MKLFGRLLLLPAICAFCVVSAGHAQVTPATFTWTGANSNDATDDGNWIAPGTPDHTNPGYGDPSNPDSLIFGNTANYSLLIPQSGVAVADLTFNADANDYTFSGDNDPEISGKATLSVAGNLSSTISGRSILLDCSLNVSLFGENTTHTVTIASGSTVTINGRIDGADESQSIEKDGAGTLALGGSNTFEGGVTVTAGTLLLGTSSQYDSESNFLSSGPVGTGTLTLYPGTTLGVDTSSTSDVTLHNAINLTYSGGTVTIDTTDASLALNGAISGSGGLDVVGGGTLALANGDSDFSGGVAVHAGALYLGTSSSGYISENNQFILQSGPVGTGVLTLDAGTTLGVSTDGGITLDNAIALDPTGGKVTVDTGNGDLTLAGNITGQAGLSLTGGNTLTLSGQNSFSGGLVNAGSTLALGSNTRDSDGFTTNFAGEIASGPVGTGTLSLGDSSTLTTAGLADVVLANNVSVHGQVGINLNQEHYDANGWNGAGYYWDGLTLGGTISGPGAIRLSGQGNFVLSGNNPDWCGGLTIIGRNLVSVFADNALGTGPLRFDAEESQGTVAFSTATPVIGGLGGGFTAYQTDGGYYYGSTVSLASGTTLTINQNADDNYAGQITGDGALVKAGPARLTLSGTNNTYTGGTTVNAGLLIVGSNSALGTGTVTLNNGGLSLACGVTLTNPLNFANPNSNPIVLAGNGTFGTPILADGRVVLSPGDSPGNLTFGYGLTLASGTAISFQVQNATGTAGTDYDLITVSNSVLNLTAASNTITFNVVFLNADGQDGAPANFDPATGYTWTFATSNNAIVGFDPAQFHLVTGGASDGLAGVFSFTESADSMSLQLNFTPVPEPSTYALLALGLGVIGLAARRQTRR